MIILLTMIFGFNIFSEDIVAEKERSIVEKNYENQVISALEGIIPRNKFTTSVSVNLVPSAEKIEKYKIEEAEGTLPGLTIKEALEETSNNNLISMVSKIFVTVILDNSVEDSKKPLIESIIKSKIKLLEARGDTLTIEKATMPVPIVKKNDMFEMFSNKFFIFMGAVGFLFMIILIITLWQLSIVKAELRSRSKIQADIEVDTKSNNTGFNDTYTDQNRNDNKDDRRESSDKEESKKVQVKTRSISEYRDKILSFGVSDHKACSSAIRKLIAAPDGIMKAAVLVEELGYEYAKKIFSGISDSKWSELGRHIKDHVEEFDPTKAIDIISEAYHLILGESISSNNGTSSNGSQFEMLSNLNENELKKLLDSETNTNIALIASQYDSEQMVDIIKLIPEDRQNAVVLEIARFENLPKELISKASSELASKLKKLHDPTKLEFKGKEYIGNFLNYLDQEQEEKILSFIEKSDPKLRDSLRKYHFSFEDVKLIPEKYIEPALEDFDTSFLAKALYKVSDELVQKISSALPKKKQLMLADDISVQQLISKKDALSARTRLLNTIKSTLTKFDFDLSSLLEDRVDEGSFGSDTTADYELKSNSSDDLDKAS